MAAEQAAIQRPVHEALAHMLPVPMQTSLSTMQASMSEMVSGIKSIGDRIDQAEATMATMKNAVKELEDEVTQITAAVKGNAYDLDAQKQALLAKLDTEFGNCKAALTTIVSQARGEFDLVKGTISELHAKTANAFQKVKEKVEGMESGGAHTETGAKGRWRGYIPAKHMVPSKFDNAEEKWRAWQDEVLDYLDTQQPGMRKLLK